MVFSQPIQYLSLACRERAQHYWSKFWHLTVKSMEQWNCQIFSLAQKLRRGERLSSKNHYPEVMTKLSSKTLREFGETYIKETRIHRGKAPFFIDKMPNNFRHIGLYI